MRVILAFLMLVATGCYGNHFPKRHQDSTNMCTGTYGDVTLSLHGAEIDLNWHGATFDKVEKGFVFNDTRGDSETNEALRSYIRIASVIQKRFPNEPGANVVIEKRKAALEHSDRLGPDFKPDTYLECT